MSDECHKPLIITNLWQTKTRFISIHLLNNLLLRSLCI